MVLRKASTAESKPSKCVAEAFVTKAGWPTPFTFTLEVSIYIPKASAGKDTHLNR